MQDDDCIRGYSTEMGRSGGRLVGKVANRAICTGEGRKATENNNDDLAGDGTVY